MKRPNRRTTHHHVEGRQRTIPLLIALLSALALVAGACGNDNKDAATDGGTTAATTPKYTPPAQDSDVKELNIFLIPSPSSTSIQSFIPAFEKETGIKVNFTETPYTEAHNKQLLSYKQKAGAYDIAQFDNTYLANFGVNQVMAPLDDYLANSPAYDTTDFSQGQLEYGKYKNTTYGLTLSTEPMIQWYRTDLLADAGLEPATTWDEYLANAEALKAAGKGGNVLGFGPGVTWWWMTLVWSFGGKLYDDNLKPQVTSDAVVKATEYLKKLLEAAPDGASSLDGDTSVAKFFSTDVGQMLNYSGYYGSVKDPATNPYIDKFETARMPMGETDITHLAGWNIGIPSDSKKQDAAWKFMEFVLGKSNAVDYLKSGAAAIGRKSITSNAELITTNPYLPLLDIPAESRIERYPQLKVWPDFQKAADEAVTPMLTGDVDIKTGLADLNTKLAGILAGENE